MSKYLAQLHNENRLCGIIFIGGENRQMIKELFKIVPSMFTSGCPVFMSREYLNETRLRLDSNILFYQPDEEVGKYKVSDIFAVKGGEPRALEVGKWDATNGFWFHASINRWDRRVDLGGVTFGNSLGDYGYQANILKDQDGCVVGSSGWFQAGRDFSAR